MRKTLSQCAVLLAFIMAPVAAHASSIVSGSQITILNVTPKGSLGGGTFSVDGPDAGSGVDFLTFCLEIDEFINYGATYFVDITLEAKEGGLGGPSPDPLDSRTAYLYSLFATNSLPGYDANNVDHRDALQLAIWRIEQEAEFDNSRYEKWGTNTAITSNATKITKANEFFNLADGTVHNGSLYGVRVMQLWTGYNAATQTFSGNKQDQLILVSDASSTLSTLLVGLAVLIVARMRVEV